MLTDSRKNSSSSLGKKLNFCIEVITEDQHESDTFCIDDDQGIKPICLGNYNDTPLQWYFNERKSSVADLDIKLKQAMVNERNFKAMFSFATNQFDNNPCCTLCHKSGHNRKYCRNKSTPCVSAR